MVLLGIGMWKRGLKNAKFTFELYFNHPTTESMSSCLLEGVRKCHFQPKAQKMVYKPVIENKEKKNLHASLINSLQNCRSVEEQIEVFRSMVKLPEENINSRLSLCRDLEKILQPYFLSSVSVCLVGSSANGLGIKGCDVDLSIQFSTLNNDRSHSQEKAEETQKVPISKVYEAKNQLLTVRKILQELKFQEPLTVIPGRCPILNFSFQNTSCDLAVNNSSALQGTNLMLLYGKLDDRVTPLMQIIIYWAKHSHLVGGPGKFKTYAIFLMVIYFLQTRNPPILPSVETVCDKAEFLKNLENWSYDVTKYVGLFQTSQNNLTVAELLREFFIFYGNYDFSHVICPITSSSADRKLFSSKMDCSNSFEFNTICIQDPLNPAWNVTTGVSWKHCKNFLKALISVWQTYQEETCWVPQRSVWGIASLIDSQFSSQNLMNVKEFTITLPLTLPADVTDSNALCHLKQGIRNVNYILNYCLGFECHPACFGTEFSSLGIPQNVRTAIENQLLKEDIFSPGSSFVFSPPQLLAQYVCSARDTFLGRSTYSSLDSSENVFERERKITEKLKQERDADNKDIFYFLCQCYGTCVEDQVSLDVKFKLLNSERFIPKLVIFSKEYIPKLMTQFGVEKR